MKDEEVFDLLLKTLSIDDIDDWHKAMIVLRTYGAILMTMVDDLDINTLCAYYTAGLEAVERHIELKQEMD